MRNIVLLDGGLGQEIYRRASEPAHPLWSAKVMMDKPELVKEVHQDFIKAGARVITINSYSCTPTRLKRDGQPEWFENLQRLALKVAHDARDELGKDASQVQIAGCLPPLIGSYSDDARSHSQLRDEYRQIVEIQAPGVDVFIIETISNTKEAKAAIEAAKETNKPVLLSFTLSDEQPTSLRAGESIRDAIQEVSTYPLDGLMFNCSFPETIAQGIEEIRDQKLPFGGYANGFTSVAPLKPGGTVDALSARKDLNEEKVAQHAMEWIDKGASIVGGCCEVGPTYIDFMHKELLRKGYQIVSFS